MTSSGPAKKTSPKVEDWHWADVLAALRKRGWSLRQIAKEENYAHGNVLGGVARHPYPKAEAILAAYAGVAHPMEIWPSRYDAKGNTNRPMGRPVMRGQKPVPKGSTLVAGRNVHRGGRG